MVDLVAFEIRRPAPSTRAPSPNLPRKSRILAKLDAHRAAHYESKYTQAARASCPDCATLHIPKQGIVGCLELATHPEIAIARYLRCGLYERRGCPWLPDVLHAYIRFPNSFRAYGASDLRRARNGPAEYPIGRPF